MFVSDNTVNTMMEYYRSELKEIYPTEEVESLIYLVFLHYKDWNRIEIRMNAESALTESELLQFHWTLKRLKKEEPIQQILGETEFYGLPFTVTPDVLIPRQETEELVDLIIKEAGANSRVLDIGTGSGCIAVTLAKKLNGAEVFAMDVSKAALEVAKENGTKNYVKLNALEGDVLRTESLPKEIGQLTTIVSNPPYILEQEKSEMSKNVLEFEPHLALFVKNDDPLLFYRKIGHLAYNHLLSGGRLYFEINEQYGTQTQELLNSIGFSDIRIIKDINQKDRIVAAIR